MSAPWEADVELETYEAQMLVEMQFPDLAPATLRPLGQGWDNWAYLVNDAYVFRFPRREIAVPLLLNEVRWLPTLASHLPLPIPQPTLVGEPEGPFPYEFAGYRLLPGTTACAVASSDAASFDADAATSLGAFVRALHAIEVPAKAPVDTIGRTDLPHRVTQIEARVAGLGSHIPDADRVLARARKLSKTPAHEEAATWVHGDLYSRHVLVDAHRAPCGVIDWGDVHAGDPALDLMIAYLMFDEAPRQAFFDAYGPTDDAMRDRARFRALFYAVALTMYGLDINDAALVRVAQRGFRRALDD